MNVAEALNTLRHCPGNYLFEVESSGQAHQVLALEYSHEPARAVVKIAEAAPTEATPEEIAKVEAAYSNWWHREGSGMQRQGEEDLEEFAARITRTAWMNGAYVRRYVAEFKLPVAGATFGEAYVAPLPEPEATIAELNAAPAPAPVAGETFGEAYVAPASEQPAPAAPKSAPSIKRHRAKKEASE